MESGLFFVTHESMAWCRLHKRTMQSTFPVTDSRVISRQLSQSERLPFFGMQTMTPFLHTSRTLACAQQVFSNRVSSLTPSLTLYLTISSVILSNPTRFECKEIAIVISATVIGPTLTCRSSAIVSRFSRKVIGGDGFLSVSLKFLTLSCASRVSRGMRSFFELVD